MQRKISMDVAFIVNLTDNTYCMLGLSDKKKTENGLLLPLYAFAN